VRRWQCFDATPTYACLPHVPARAAALTPGAKVVFMVGGEGVGAREVWWQGGLQQGEMACGSWQAVC
jgi:hypothetical protein